MTTRRRNGTQPNGGRPRFDRAAAFAYYVALGPERTKRAVAAEFQVSEQTIGKWARLEEWDAKAEALDRKAAQRVANEALRTLEERRVRTIKVAEKARDTVLGEGVELDPNRALGVLPALAKHEELIAGEATDRIGLAEFRDFDRAWREALLATIPPEFHERFFADYAGRLSEIKARLPHDDEPESEAA